MDKIELIAWGFEPNYYQELLDKNDDTNKAILCAIVFHESGKNTLENFTQGTENTYNQEKLDQIYNNFCRFYDKEVVDKCPVDNMIQLDATSERYQDIYALSELNRPLSEELKQEILEGKKLSDEAKESIMEETTKVVDEIVEDEQVVSGKKVNAYERYASRIGAGLGAVTIALAGCGVVNNVNGASNTEGEPEVAAEQQATEETQKEEKREVPSMVDKDFAYYTENALDTIQKATYLNINEFVNNVNASEDWEKVTLSSAKAQELGYENPECVFGFTAEEMYNFALRFGNYTKQELLTLTGGKDLDVQTITSDSTNLTLDKISAYYVNSDKCELGIEKVVNFNEKEVKVIHEFEKLFQEYHALDNDKTAKEAETKMVEIKEKLIEVAHSQDKDLETGISYILRTFERAALNLSQTHNYRATIELDVINTDKNRKDTIEVKTSLFDELTSRSLVAGFDETWDPELFLQNVGVSSKKYNLLYGNEDTSIADLSCGAQRARLEEANKYIRDTKILDLGSKAVNSMEETEYDALTYGTYDADVINNMIDNQLMMDGKYPQNTDYFSYVEITEKQIEYMDTHGITAGKPGDTFELTPEQVAELPSTVQWEAPHYVDKKGKPSTEEKVKEEAREQLDEEKGFVTEEEGQKEAEDIQAVAQQAYDAAYKHFSAGNTNDLPEYANHSSEIVRNSYNFGKIDGIEAYKVLQDIAKNPTTGGEVHINTEYDNYEKELIEDQPVVNENTNVDTNTNTNTDTAAASEGKADTNTNSTPEVQIESPAPAETTPTGDVAPAEGGLKEGEIFVDPTLDDDFCPVVTLLENQEEPKSYSDEEIQTFASSLSDSELADLFGLNNANAEENVEEEVQEQGFSK